MEEGPVTREEHNALKQVVAENLRVSKENNHLLLRMQYWGRVAFWAKVLIWTIVLVLPILLYSYISPLMNILPGGAGNTASGTATSLFGFPSPSEFHSIIHPGT